MEKSKVPSDTDAAPPKGIDEFEDTLGILDEHVSSKRANQLMACIERIIVDCPYAAEKAKMCRDALRKEPITLRRALVATYILNDGIAIRHTEDTEKDEVDTTEFENLILTVDTEWP